MTTATVTKPVVEPTAEKFLNDLKAQGGPPIYTLSPEEARKLLVSAQSGSIQKMDADITDHVLPVGPSGQVDIRILKPKGSTNTLPVIMYIHGGGWILGDKQTHDRLVRQLANKAEAAVVFVNYSRSPEAQYPIAIEEAYEATKYIAENAAQFNVDANRLAIVGDSVGGCMAAVLTLMLKERGGPKVEYLVLFYPVTAANFETESYNQFADGYWLSKEAMKWFWNAYQPDEAQRNQPYVSPLFATTEQLKGFPHTLIITGEMDVLRDEGEAFARKLMQAGVNVEPVRLLGIIHDFVMLDALAETPQTKLAVGMVGSKLRLAFHG